MSYPWPRLLCLVFIANSKLASPETRSEVHNDICLIVLILFEPRTFTSSPSPCVNFAKFRNARRGTLNIIIVIIIIIISIPI